MFLQLFDDGIMLRALGYDIAFGAAGASWPWMWHGSGADFIHWKLVLITSISAATFAYFGAGWLKDLSNDTLTRVFGIILVVFGVKMLLQGK